MYVTINRFVLKPDATAQFEELWQRQGAAMDDVPGFLRFVLLKEAGKAENRIQYAVFVEWESEGHFGAWVGSPAFRAAHQGLPDLTDLYIEPPVLTRYQSVLS